MRLALERRGLTAQVQQHERLYRKLTEYSGDLTSIIAPNGETQYVSPSIERVLGYVPEERIGVNVFQGVHPDDLARVIRVFQEGLRPSRLSS